MQIVKENHRDIIKQAWLNLASDVLLLAIADVRQKKDGRKREKAQQWLLSPAAKLFFESLDFELEVENWVKAGCPKIGKR